MRRRHSVMGTNRSIVRQAWFRLLTFAAVIGLALGVNARWRQKGAAPASPEALPGVVFPTAAGALQMTALEPPSALGRQELWARYQANPSKQTAYISLSYGVESFHSWIGCFLVEGPQPLWSGTLAVPPSRGKAQFEAAVLRQAGRVRAVAHSECWHGGWRGSAWQTRWFALWRRPEERVPLINAYIVTNADGEDPGALKQQLTTFLSGLNWQALNAVCAAAR